MSAAKWKLTTFLSSTPLLSAAVNEIYKLSNNSLSFVGLNSGVMEEYLNTLLKSLEDSLNLDVVEIGSTEVVDGQTESSEITLVPVEESTGENSALISDAEKSTTKEENEVLVTGSSTEGEISEKTVIGTETTSSKDVVNSVKSPEPQQQETQTPSSKGSSGTGKGEGNKNSAFFATGLTYEKALEEELNDQIPDFEDVGNFRSAPPAYKSLRAPKPVAGESKGFTDKFWAYSIGALWRDVLALAPDDDVVWDIKVQKINNALKKQDLNAYGWGKWAKGTQVTKKQIIEKCQDALSRTPMGAALTFRRRGFFNMTYYVCAKPGAKKPNTWWYSEDEHPGDTSYFATAFPSW